MYKWEPLVGHNASPILLHSPLAGRESPGCSVHPKVGGVGGWATKLF